MNFKRGDMVLYRGLVYYFQPNGLSCLLYDRLNDIGKTSYAVFRPGIKQIRKPTENDIKDFLTNPRPVPKNRLPDSSNRFEIVILPYSPTRVTIPADSNFIPKFVD